MHTLRTLISILILLLGLALGGVVLAEPKPSNCGPGDGGSPCGGDGPASQGNDSQTNQGAGNPINVITGNKYQVETDLPALPGVLGLEIVRHYNSSYSKATAANGILGRGWKLSYETDLYPIGNTLQILQADGTRIIFIRDPKNPSLCATHNPAHGRVVINKTAQGEDYTWTWANGRRLSFNTQGKLIQIKAPSGEFVTLTRDPAGALMKVTDPEGRSLTLGYLDSAQARANTRFKGVYTIDSPVGRYRYSYGGLTRETLANLVTVELPGNIKRRYHYEDAHHPTLLTGISIETRNAKQQPVLQRLSTWGYDVNGRANLSYKGEKPKPDQAGLEQVKLSFKPGVTELTNSLNQKTVYRHAILGEEYRLLEVTGAGCASCGEANVKYGYDTLGRLTGATKLDRDRKPLYSLHRDYDVQGRLIKLSRVDHQNGRPAPSTQLVRYEYGDDSNRPSLIARPSVIPGKEAITRISYNSAGQPIQITETGYAPMLPSGPETSIQRVANDGTSSKSNFPRATKLAQPNEAIALERTIRYRYGNINGRSVLTEIDGPLKNGPGNSPLDSDITQLKWDRSGNHIDAMIAPGGFSHTVTYDEAGRIHAVTDAQTFTTNFDYSPFGQILRVTSYGSAWAESGIKPIVQINRYDALGNPIETGSVNGGTYRSQVRLSFDAAGRLLWQAEALGILKRASYDSEGHIVKSSVSTRSFEQAEYYRYDALNRLITISNNSGLTKTIAYSNSNSIPSPRASAFTTFTDDFGREIAVMGPSHGTQIKRYDEADQWVAQTNDKGESERYAYDLAGHRIRATLFAKDGKVQSIVAWRYAHNRLVEIADAAQTERIRYNERGQPATRTITLRLNSGAYATHTTRYNYDADGSLESQSLPDGSTIVFERNGQGQVVAVHRRTSSWSGLGWGQTVLVKNLQRDLIGLRSVTYGNGIQGQWQRSRQGMLARIVYTRDTRSGSPGVKIASNTLAQARLSAAARAVLDAFIPAAHAQNLPPKQNKLPGALGLPVDANALFDARLLYDPAGDVILQQQAQGAQRTQAYAYDARHQLIAAQTFPRSTKTLQTSSSKNQPTLDARIWRYAYDGNGNGNRILAQDQVPIQEMGQTRKASYHPGSSALIPPPDSSREYVWDGQGRLIAVRQENKDLARYRYDHRGLRVGKQTGNTNEYTLYNDQRQRVADLNAEGKITRQYIWLADQLIATLDATQPKTLQAPAEGFWQELAQNAQALWTKITGHDDRIAYIHVNHLGAPIAATDEAGQTLWQADYAPYGKLIKVSAGHQERSDGGRTGYTLALRYPGQWQDDESGLYYNDQRYYDPHAGRYLSPDPLGKTAETLGSPNPYAYVNNNPLSYIDPWGLILFAFDGTGNTPASNTNVLLFAQNYQDNDPELASVGAEKPYYIEGVGTGPILPKLDGAIAFTLRSRINQQLDQLDLYVTKKVDNVLNVKREEISKTKPLTITLDIVGFSRGAASARDFANTVVARANSGYYRKLDGVNGACVAVKIRFMGLFDTVLSYAAGSFNMGIPEAVEYVSQAVAVNEHRHDFPLESIEPSYMNRGLSSTRTERGFVGAHSDIGGGYNCAGGAAGGCDGGDLSDVALNWMVAEATRSGVSMGSLPEELRTITNPILHSEIRTTPFNIWGVNQDRQVRYPVASDAPSPLPKQRGAPIEGMTYTDSLAWITRDSNPTGSREGVVDMTAYSAWLKANYGLSLQ